MNRIASTSISNTFSSMSLQRQYGFVALGQKPDQVLFGHKDKHGKHDHHHGHDCASEKKPNWFRKKYETVKGWFKTKKTDKVCSDTHCEKPHKHDHAPHDHSHGNWLERQYHAIKEWFRHVKAHIKEDWINLHGWLVKKFPNALKHSPRP